MTLRISTATPLLLLLLCSSPWATPVDTTRVGTPSGTPGHSSWYYGYPPSGVDHLRGFPAGVPSTQGVPPAPPPAASGASGVGSSHLPGFPVEHLPGFPVEHLPGFPTPLAAAPAAAVPAGGNDLLGTWLISRWGVSGDSAVVLSVLLILLSLVLLVLVLYISYYVGGPWLWVRVASPLLLRYSGRFREASWGYRMLSGGDRVFPDHVLAYLLYAGGYRSVEPCTILGSPSGTTHRVFRCIPSGGSPVVEYYLLVTDYLRGGAPVPTSWRLLRHVAFGGGTTSGFLLNLSRLASGVTACRRDALGRGDSLPESSRLHLVSPFGLSPGGTTALLAPLLDTLVVSGAPTEDARCDHGDPPWWAPAVSVVAPVTPVTTEEATHA